MPTDRTSGEGQRRAAAKGERARARRAAEKRDAAKAAHLASLARDRASGPSDADVQKACEMLSAELNANGPALAAALDKGDRLVDAENAKGIVGYDPPLSDAQRETLRGYYADLVTIEAECQRAEQEQRDSLRRLVLVAEAPEWNGLLHEKAQIAAREYLDSCRNLRDRFDEATVVENEMSRFTRDRVMPPDDPASVLVYDDGTADGLAVPHCFACNGSPCVCEPIHPDL